MISILNTILIVVVALCITGVINRTRAILSGRKGVRALQHIYDVRVLLNKGAVYSSTTTALFRITPAVYLGTALVAALFIPVGNLQPLLSFDGDFVYFAYLLALGRFSLVLAAMDTGSSFEGMGASREALYGALVEPAIMFVVATMVLISGNTSFATLFTESALQDNQMIIVLLLASYVLLKITFIESGRVPIDDPRTHLELTMIHEVMCLDYCGVDLAMIKIAGWFKTAALAMLAINAFLVGFDLQWWLALPLAIIIPGVSIGVVESTRARNKLARNTIYILIVTLLALLTLFIGYLLQLNIKLL